MKMTRGPLALVTILFAVLYWTAGVQLTAALYEHRVPRPPACPESLQPREWARCTGAVDRWERERAHRMFFWIIELPAMIAFEEDEPE